LKIALIGFGAMGQLVAKEARDAGEQIGYVSSTKNRAESVKDMAQHLRDHDVTIDFSVADAVLRNVEACVLAGVPLVEGTTGWRQHEDVRRIVTESDGALVYGANFSIGMNIFYRVVKSASEYFSKIDQYSPFIEEAHHSRKRDAPSGTAIQLGKLMREEFQKDIPTSSTRAGYIPGTHRVGFDSVADQVLLTHTARSRQGFAVGALLAARWIIGRKGMFEFGEIIEEILTREI